MYIANTSTNVFERPQLDNTSNHLHALAGSVAALVVLVAVGVVPWCCDALLVAPPAADDGSSREMNLLRPVMERNVKMNRIYVPLDKLFGPACIDRNT